MAKYVDPTQIDYRYGGDKLSNFAQKYMTTIAYVFNALNELKSPGAVQATGAEPYQFKVEDDHLFIRNGENTEWIKLMDVALYGGFKNNTFGKLQCGDYEHRPATGNANYDTYWCTNGAVYQWLNDQWNIILSKNVEDLDGYEHLILDEHTAVAGGTPHKILWTNSLGQLDTDITGSPGKIAGKTVYAPEVQDNQVLVFNAERNRWEVNWRDVITWDDTSTIGTANKLVQADEYGKINIDTTGNAGKIAGKSIDANNLQNEQALVFDSIHQTFVNQKVATVDGNGVAAIDISGNAAKVAQAAIVVDDLQNGDVLVYKSSNNTFINRKGAFTDENGVVQANVSGSAAKWGGKVLLVPGIEDGQILVWSEANQAFINRNQGAIGTGRALAISQDGVSLANYNGDAYKAVNIVTPHLRVSAQAYTVGSVCFSNELPYTTYLECTTQGVTGNAEPSYAGVSVGDTVVDGSVVWTVRSFVTTGSGSAGGAVDIDISGNAGGIDTIDESETYSVGDIVFDGDTNPSTCFICVSGTTSETIEGGTGEDSEGGNG